MGGKAAAVTGTQARSGGRTTAFTCRFTTFAHYSSPLASMLAWLGEAWLGEAWLGEAWLGEAWLGEAWLGEAWLAPKPGWVKPGWVKPG